MPIVHIDSGGSGYAKPTPIKKATPKSVAAPAGLTLSDLLGGVSGGSVSGQASQIVGAQLDPQIGALSQLAKQAKTAGNQSIQDIAKYYGAAGSAINSSKGAVESETQNAIGQIGKLYGATQGAQRNIYGGAQKDIIGELSRLGLSSVIPSASKQTASDAQFVEAITRLQGKNAQSMSKQMGTNTSGLISAIASEAAASGAQSKTQMQREMTRIIQNLSMQSKMLEASRKGQEMQVGSQLSSAAGSQQMARARFMLDAQGKDPNSDYNQLRNANLVVSLQLKQQELSGGGTSKKGVEGGLNFLGSHVKDQATYGHYSNLIINASTQPDLATANTLIAGFVRQYKIPPSDSDLLYRANAVSFGK